MINLFMLCCACGFSACAGLSALHEDTHQEFKQQEKVEFKQDNKKFVSYNDNDYQITLTIDEVDNFNFYNLTTFLCSNDFSEFLLNGSYIDTSLDGVIFDHDFNDKIEEDGVVYYRGNKVAFIVNSSTWNSAIESGVNFNDYDICFYSTETYLDSSLYFTIDSNNLPVDYTINEVYSLLKQAIELDIQAYTTGQEDYQNALGQFVQILVGGIQSLATGVASGIVGMASALFLETDNGSVTGLSVFGGIVAIFAGLALAIALTTKVYTWVTSLGN